MPVNYGLGSSNTNPEACWRQIDDWYSSCLDSHVACKVPNAVTNWLPTRLLDIGHSAGACPRLVTTANEKDACGPYATLSHCWGGSNILKLMTENIDDLHKAIPMEQLPRTFVEAITVARQLGLRYIWIDSLCIVQDCFQDWQKEASVMGDVYSNSQLNIAATASQDSHGGLFRMRDPREIMSCKVAVSWEGFEGTSAFVMDRYMWLKQLGKAPLSQRGWVLQERVLPPRALHFGEKQLFWECREYDACEMYPRGLPRTMFDYCNRVKLVDPLAFHKEFWGDTRKSSKFAMYELWCRNVFLYSDTCVTRESDKLVAISGLAKMMLSLCDDTYLAGLWLRQLPTELLWQVRGRRSDGSRSYRPSTYRAPTWSWASVEGPVFPCIPNDDFTLCIKIQEAMTIPASGNDEAGAVMAGHIRLFGAAIQGILTLGSQTPNTFQDKLHINGHECPGNAFADVPRPNLKLEITCLIVCWGKILDDENLYMLLLQAAPGKPRGWYERVGMAKLEMDYTLTQELLNSADDESLYLEKCPRCIILI